MIASDTSNPNPLNIVIHHEIALPDSFLASWSDVTRLVPTGGDDGGSGGVGWAGMSFEPDGDSGMVRERERERWCLALVFFHIFAIYL